MKKWIVIFAFAIALIGCSTPKQTIATSKTSEPKITPSIEQTSTQTESSNAQIETLIDEAKQWIGTPYVYGGQSRTGTDCSGFILEIFKKIFQIKLPRSAALQHEYAKPINLEIIAPGDLLFFTTGKSSNRVNHVGLYIGQGKMIHASSSRGVMESGITENYWKKAHHSCGRILNQQSTPAPTSSKNISSSNNSYEDDSYVSNPEIFD